MLRVVYFWSPSCPCVTECQEASLIPLWQRYGKPTHAHPHPNVTFIAVASNASSLAYSTDPKTGKERVSLYLTGTPEQRPPFPIVVDSHHRIANSLGAESTPEAFLLDSKNRILFHGDPDDSVAVRYSTGNPGVTHHYLADALREALAGKRVTVPIAPNLGCPIDRSDELPEQTPPKN